ncbi:transcription factor MYBS1-like [Papaver somniferum]|uniref:transcription factor MYBS1-like n=1 Tax=Papaver somniferum TaxID=3469 RepID=UPI000E705CD7|nr:transcription factor MYBS1-like [Papaver somniferum]
MEIETYNIELPNYLVVGVDDYDQSGGSTIKTKTDGKKGIPWTKDEHRKFLEGLEQFSKGDWRSISRFFIVSRTPTQVASHAQKYFQHQGTKKHKKQRKRPSIHDTPSVIEEANNTMNSLNVPGGAAHAPVMMVHPNQQSLPKMDDPYARSQGGSFPSIHDTPFVADNKKWSCS